jgi:hypothetical protein
VLDYRQVSKMNAGQVKIRSAIETCDSAVSEVVGDCFGEGFALADGFGVGFMVAVGFGVGFFGVGFFV